MWWLPIFCTRANENHIRPPLCGGVYDFKLRKPLSQQCLRLRYVTESRLQNLLRDCSLRSLHFICKSSVAQWRPPESFTCPVHVSARAGINHRQQTNRQRLSHGKHLCRMADLPGVCAIQTTKNSHRCPPPFGKPAYKHSQIVNAPASNINGVTTTPTLK